jgi:predicted house-cleaning noncanonical NTP pyrophosphatase (MazG superfamily)
MANTKTYDKLVRDRIPEIIEKEGKHCVYSVLSREDYLSLLDLKLNEELAEYQESKSMEELADLLEVMRAVVLARGSSMEEVERIRIRKAEKRGGFEKRIMLETVTEG